MSAARVLLWFRQDLRLRDNPALLDAVAAGEILPVYILDDAWMGAASCWWLHHSLARLQQSLDGRLLLFRGDAQRVIRDIVKQEQVTAVCWNRCYEPWRITRDKAIKSSLEAAGVSVNTSNGSLLWEPWQILKQDKTFYKVFTPYYRNGCLQAAEPRFPLDAPKAIRYARHSLKSLSLDELNLLPSIPWYEGMAGEWTPGEAGASDRLSVFLKSAIKQYKTNRNVPSIEGTSRLSPHLHFGELSPNQAWYAARHAVSRGGENLDTFLSELGWREFSYYLLFHFPELPTKNFNSKFDHFPWRKDNKALRAWQQGKTGIPIVDAGMRELWQTGYMHNRVRMIVASFLVKNLLIDWREGEAWFRDCLVDADLANNCASWQWVAGSGADAAPYFRIFNPVLQGEKFDSRGVYVRHYCPELMSVPDKYIHKPWLIPGGDFPPPMVDLSQSRTRALRIFSDLHA